MVEIDEKPVLSCLKKMNSLEGKSVNTIEGFPEDIKETIIDCFLEKGAVQCGFCSPGFLMRTMILLKNQPSPGEAEIRDALKFNFCRCTGYKKIVDAIRDASERLMSPGPSGIRNEGIVGTSLKKYGAAERMRGEPCFTDDIRIDGMLYSALKFSDHPRAKVLKIDISKAEKSEGVIAVVTWKDIPGERFNGLIINDWPLMIAEDETTNYIGDVLSGVIAESEKSARKAVKLIEVEYDVLEPAADLNKSLTGRIKVHESGNILEKSVIKRGLDCDESLKNSKYIYSAMFETQRIEHAFLEVESSVAVPMGKDGIEIYSQGQGVYEDRRQISRILGIDENFVKVIQVPTGGAFGGKEDLSVQGHTALFAFITGKPVKLKLNREESFRMHPKRHPLKMEYSLGCNSEVKLTALRARIAGDTGAYASVGAKVLERAAGHASGAYFVPNVDIESIAVYTNNVPCGAMRGFGVNQVTFAMESCIDDLCRVGNFDRWQFRYENAVDEGSATATGQVLGKEAGIRATLQAVKEQFYSSKNTGIACAIKNVGIGNGMRDFSEVRIDIESEKKVILMHGWTEMGQGVDTVAVQVLSTETGIDPSIIKVRVITDDHARAGMTTSSRGTSLLGNAIIDASKKIKKDLKKNSLKELSGKSYRGSWSFDLSTKPGADGAAITHFSYGFATQLAILDESGNLKKIVAAHDGGKIINPVLFESQIHGSVHMGLGYVLTENFQMKNGMIIPSKLRDLGIIGIKDMPDVELIPVEVKDRYGPYGAKGVGEIGLVPTAAAVANAFSFFDGIRRTKLPLNLKTGKEKKVSI